MSKYLHIVYLTILLILSWKIFDLHNTNSELARLVYQKQNVTIIKEKDNRSSPISGITVVPQSSYELLDVKTNKIVSLPVYERKLNLYIFFTLQDCTSCFDEIPFWNELYLKYGEVVDIQAIVYEESREQVSYFAQSREIDIPIYIDKRSEFFDDLQIIKGGHTPLKVLVDGRGAILNRQSTTRSDRELQEEYLTLIANEIRSL